MSPAGGFSRAVPRRRAFNSAFRRFRCARRRRAIIAAVTAAVREMFFAQEVEADHNMGGSQQPPMYNDEELVDEFLRGHERGLRLGLRRGHESGYRQGLAEGFAHGLRQGEQRGYVAGFNDGAEYGSD